MDLERSLAQKIYDKEGCQWIGPEQEKWPFTMCGCKVVPNSPYCEEHYAKMYIGGAPKKKRRSVSLVVKKQQWDGDISELMWEVYEELLAEGEIEA